MIKFTSFFSIIFAALGSLGYLNGNELKQNDVKAAKEFLINKGIVDQKELQLLYNCSYQGAVFNGLLGKVKYPYVELTNADKKQARYSILIIGIDVMNKCKKELEPQPFLGTCIANELKEVSKGEKILTSDSSSDDASSKSSFDSTEDSMEEADDDSCKF